MTQKRLNHELPYSVSEWGWKYHHLGIPTDKKMPDETYLSEFKLFVAGFDSSPFGIEWMRFEKNSPVSNLIRTIPHIAFEVRNIEEEILKHDLKVISKPESNTKGIKVAMIEHNGAPIELIEFEKNK